MLMHFVEYVSFLLFMMLHNIFMYHIFMYHIFLTWGVDLEKKEKKPTATLQLKKCEGSINGNWCKYIVMLKYLIKEFYRVKC